MSKLDHYHRRRGSCVRRSQATRAGIASHQFPIGRRQRRGSMRQMNFKLASLLIAATSNAVAGGAVSPERIQRRPTVCRAERDAALDVTSESNAPEARAIRRDIDSAHALFRFHRINEAGAAIDAAEKRLQRSRSLLAGENRTSLEAALAALRSCVSSATPPAMATLTVRTNDLAQNAGNLTERSAGAGVYIRVENIPVGRTSEAGTLTAQVPSGAVTVTAMVPPNALGETSVRLSPASARTVAITLDEDTDLVLVEAYDGVLRADVTSLTLQFVQNGHPVVVKEVEAVHLLSDAGDVERNLTPLFAASGTGIVAVDPQAVLGLLPDDPSAVIRVRVEAADPARFGHSNVVEFRITRGRIR
jgi:hypothetical protein